METIIAYTSGKARGNPGPAAAGVCIIDATGMVLREVKKNLGNATDDFAEYYGVMLALQTIKHIYDNKSREMMIEVRLANELVKKQLNNEYEITEPGLVPMFIEIHNMRVASFPNLTFTQVSQEENKEADRLVNAALDGK